MAHPIGSWLFSISDENQPSDADGPFPTREAAAAAAVAKFWTQQDRDAMKASNAKYGSDARLRFFVGRVRPAKLQVLEGRFLVDAIADCQERGETGDVPVGWPELTEEQVKLLEGGLAKLLETFLRATKRLPDWTAVDWELVEITP
jgi:hypothetical protein